MRAGNKSVFVFLTDLALGRTVQAAFLAIALNPFAKSLFKCAKTLGLPFSANFPFPLIATVIGGKGTGL
jgi:hypothetical protein